jgi:hypothetical protein
MAMGPILVPAVESVSGILDLDLARLLRSRSGPAPGISWHPPDHLSLIQITCSTHFPERQFPSLLQHSLGYLFGMSVTMPAYEMTGILT